MTRKSRMLNRRIELWETVKAPDGFGGSTIQKQKVRDLWGRVSDIRFESYDQAGAVSNKDERLVIVRQKNIDTNINFFVVEGKEYQINNVQSNYKKTQYECRCEAI